MNEFNEQRGLWRERRTGGGNEKQLIFINIKDSQRPTSQTNTYMEKRPSACALLLFNYLYPDPLTPRIVAFFVSLVILSFSLAGGAGRKSSHLYNHILWASGPLIYRINGIHQFFLPPRSFIFINIPARCTEHLLGLMPFSVFDLTVFCRPSPRARQHHSESRLFSGRF